ncbi:M protein [Granada virus]|nr:M protein [Granada virus]
MLYPKIIILLCFVQGFSLKYTIISELGTSTTRQVCLSSSTDLDTLLDISAREMDAIKLTGGYCQFGELKKPDCNPDLYSNYISNVHGDLLEASAVFEDIIGGKKMVVKTDSIADLLTPGAHNCSLLERKPFWSDLIPPKEVGKTDPVVAVMSVLPVNSKSSFSAEMREKDKEIAAIREKLEVERRNAGRVEDEARKRMREMEDELRRGWEIERSEKSRVKAELEEEQRKKQALERELHEIDKALKISERTNSDLNNKLSATKTSTTRPASSTLATVIITSLLASASSVLVELKDRDTNHILNRPGNAMYTSSESSLTQAGCTIGYGQKCLPWELQASHLNYPFFASNIDKYSILEATTETTPIVSKSNDSCELSTTAGPVKECTKEAGMIKKYCSDDVRAYFFINSQAKLAIVSCKDNQILSEDCNFCISKTRGSNQIMYMPVQDAFCQKNGNDIVPTVRYSKDICSIGVRKIKQCKRTTSRHERMGFIIVGLKKLYIEDMKMRSRQDYNVDQFLCYEVTASTTVKYKRVLPKNCKDVETGGTKRCSGDEYFCNRYQCDTSNPEAHCILRRHAAEVEVNVGGVWLKPKCIGYERVLVKRSSVKVENLSSRECSSCLWECNKNQILVKTHGPKIVYSVACSHGSCKSVNQDPSTFVHLDYPGNGQIIGGDIGIHMTEEGSPSNLHLKIHCEPRDSCDVSDCLFCAHGLLNYQCHTIASAIFISTCVAAVIMIIWKILSKIKFVTGSALTLIATPLKWFLMLSKWLLQGIKDRASRLMRTANNAIGWEQDVERGRPQVRGQRNQAARYSFYGVAIFSLFTTGLCCSESVVAESNIMQCMSSGAGTTCKASGTVILKLGPIGSESCLILKGLKDNEKQFISIKTVSSELTCREGESFWTSLYSPVCLSSRRCHLMGECTGDVCLKWKSNKTSAEFTGRTHNEVLHDNRCFEQSGGMGYGCFNVNPSCLLVHTYLRSVYKNGFRVFRCVAWNHRVKLLITTQNRKYGMTLMAMSTQPTDWGSIGLILDSEGVTGTNAYSFMRHGQGSYALIDEPYSIEPRKGFIGEVRCPTEETAVKASPSCKIAPHLIEYQPEMDIVECTINMIDPMAIFNRGSLPQVRDGVTFTQSIEKNSIQAMTTGEIKASVRLTLDDYEVEYKITNVNCDATFVNITGCYSCDEGARLCIKVIAGGEAIFHFVDTEESINVLFKTGSTPTIHCTTLHFSRPVVNFEGQYDCGQEKKPMAVKGTLVAIAPHNDRVQSGGSSVVINPKNKTVDFLGWLSGLSSWLGGPLKTILTVLGFLVIGLIFVVLTIYIVRFGVTQAIIKRKKK